MEENRDNPGVQAPDQKNLIVEEKTEDDSRSSGRKSKKTKHDIDDDEKQKKKSRQGSRKRRVEELISEDLLDEDLGDEEVLESSEPAEAVTLGLATPRAKRGSGAKAAKKHSFNAPTEEIKKEVEIAETVSVQQLSQKMSVKASDLIKALFNLGIVKSITQTIDQETAQLLAEEFGHKVKLIDAETMEKGLEDDLIYQLLDIYLLVTLNFGEEYL